LGKFGKRANALDSALSGGTEDSEKLKVESEKLKVLESGFAGFWFYNFP